MAPCAGRHCGLDDMTCRRKGPCTHVVHHSLRNDPVSSDSFSDARHSFQRRMHGPTIHAHTIWKLAASLDLDYDPSAALPAVLKATRRLMSRQCEFGNSRNISCACAPGRIGVGQKGGGGVPAMWDVRKVSSSTSHCSSCSSCSRASATGLQGLSAGQWAETPDCGEKCASTAAQLPAVTKTQQHMASNVFPVLCNQATSFGPSGCKTLLSEKSVHVRTAAHAMPYSSSHHGTKVYPHPFGGTWMASLQCCST